MLCHLAIYEVYFRHHANEISLVQRSRWLDRWLRLESQSGTFRHLANRFLWFRLHYVLALGCDAGRQTGDRRRILKSMGQVIGTIQVLTLFIPDPCRVNIPMLPAHLGKNDIAKSKFTWCISNLIFSASTVPIYNCYISNER